MHRAFVKLREKNCGVGFHFYLAKGLFQELVFFFVCLFQWLNLQTTCILKVKLVMRNL